MKSVQAQKGPNCYLLAALAFIPLADGIARVSFPRRVSGA
jgi:hypothetical protein